MSLIIILCRGNGATPPSFNIEIYLELRANPVDPEIFPPMAILCQQLKWRSCLRVEKGIGGGICFIDINPLTEPVETALSI